jgi:hypothetical protein
VATIPPEISRSSRSLRTLRHGWRDKGQHDNKREGDAPENRLGRQKKMAEEGKVALDSDRFSTTDSGDDSLEWSKSEGIGLSGCVSVLV